MAAVTALTGRSLFGKVALALAARSRARNGRPAKAAAFVAEHTGTLAALGFADAACWHWGTTAGLIGTAVCVLVAEFKVRG
jgi:hypothetical protein